MDRGLCLTLMVSCLVRDDLTRRFKAGQDQLLTLVADLGERNKELQQTLGTAINVARPLSPFLYRSIFFVTVSFCFLLFRPLYLLLKC